MVDYKKALVAILENTLENVNAGNTNITEEEASVIIDSPTVTGYASYNPCACHTTTPTPSAN